MIFCSNASIDNANDVQFYGYPTIICNALVLTVLILLPVGGIFVCNFADKKTNFRPSMHLTEEALGISDHCMNITYRKVTKGITTRTY